MREQSSSNISNTHKVFRGGETKVMKKSLVSLLVFALVFTMVAPAFAAAETGLSDIGNSYAKEEIEALVEAGIIGGYPDGTFKPRNAITRAEFAKILALAAGLEEDAAAASVFTDVPAWAAGYVGALVNAEITKGKSETRFGSNDSISRQELAVFFVRAWGLEEAAEESTLEVKFNDASSVAAWAKAHVALAGEIEFILGNPNGTFNPTGNAERQAVARLGYEFYANGDEYKEAAEKVLGENQPAPDHATKVEKVYADNLIQVKIEFDGSLDSRTASDAYNYTVSGQDNPDVKSASVVDENTVVLTLEEALENQLEYEVSFNNVRASDNQTILSLSNHTFRPVDNTLPYVESVEALGNSAVRVKFNEPIPESGVTNSNFKVGDRILYGNLRVTNDTVIIRLASRLAEGDYTLTVEDVEDYAKFKSLKSEHDFTVVQDTEAPTIEEVVHATFEYVTLKFSEPVDPDTVQASNVHWLQGTTKRYAQSVSQLSDDTFRFNFGSDSNRLQYRTELYVSGVKDYSGNTIAADTKIEVNPVIDETRPEVVSVRAEDENNLTIRFNKTLQNSSATNSANYVIKNSSGTEVARVKYPTLESDNRTVKIRLAGSGLTGGATYTLEVSGVSDRTTLNNVMLPFSTQFTVSDKSAPRAETVTYNSTGNYLVVTFNKKIATNGDGSAVDAGKYVINFEEPGEFTGWVNLPSRTNLNISADGKSVLIYLPSSFTVSGDTKTGDQIKNLRVSAIKDEAGNWANPITKDLIVGEARAAVVESVYATDNNRVEVTFDRPILGTSVTASDFTLVTANGNVNVLSASISGSSKVVLTLPNNNTLSDAAKYSGEDVDIRVRANSRTQTSDGARLTAGDYPVEDRIAPKVDSVTGSSDGSTFVIEFKEELRVIDFAEAKSDIRVYDGNRNILAQSQYNVTAIEGNKITVTFTSAKDDVFSVQLVHPRYIVDAEGNLAAHVENPIEFETKTR